MNVSRIGVVGAGQMGAGIAQVAAMAGIRVAMQDVSDAALQRGSDAIATSLEKLVRREKMTALDAEAARARVEVSTDVGVFNAADFVIEAAAEDEALKRAIFSRLDAITPPHAILASNTSSISITRLGSATQRPGGVIGMHFMNPVPLMPLVELIRGMATTDATSDATRALASTMGKTVIVAEDRPGFAVNRILMPMINEAFYALQEGVASKEDIDAGMKLGTNQPMGPLTLGDFIGLDTCLSIMRVLHDGLGDSKYRPCPLLVSYVDAGWYGRKSGRGVYEYRR